MSFNMSFQISRDTLMPTQQPVSHQTQRGLTLIELMIVVGVIGVIAAIAIPSFLSQNLKSKRVDASHPLLDIATKQELYFARNGSYTNKFYQLNADKVSTEKLYSIAIESCDSSTPNDFNTCFTVVATPAAGSPQLEDTQCQKFTYHSRDGKLAEDANGNDTSGICW